MAKRQIVRVYAHRVVTDEILEHIAEVIGEMTSQIDGDPNDRMVEIADDTPETIPLTARIEERYTTGHMVYFAETTAE